MSTTASVSSSTFNTTESGMWENERQVRENSRIAGVAVPASAQNAADYLPQFIARRFGENGPVLANSCRLKGTIKPASDTIQFRYSVSWIEDRPVHQEIHRMPISSITKRSERRTSSSQSSGQQKLLSNFHAAPSISSSTVRPAGEKTRCCRVDASRLPVKSVSEALLAELTPTQNVEVNVELGSKEALTPQVRQCDGPCAQMRAVQDLRILGRCDHAVCSLCVVNAPMVSTDDGSMGCCNKRCFAIDLVNRVPDQKRRHELYQNIFKNKGLEDIFKLYQGDVRRARMKRADLASSNLTVVSSNHHNTSPGERQSPVTSSSLSVTSVPSTLSSAYIGSMGSSYTESSSMTDSDRRMPQEMLMLRLVVLEASYFGTVKRHRFEEEVGSKGTIASAIDLLMGQQASQKLLNKPTRIFYCPGDVLDTAKLLELDAKKHAITTMSKLATNRGIINLVVDFTGRLFKGARPLYQPDKTSK